MESFKKFKGMIEILPLRNVINPPKHFRRNKYVKYLCDLEFWEQILLPFSYRKIKGEKISFSKYRLVKDMKDRSIIHNLKLRNKFLNREVIVHAIISLTREQPKGQKGKIMTNNFSTIIGYIKCDDMVVRCVYIFWDSEEKAWICFCEKLDYMSKGGEVLCLEW